MLSPRTRRTDEISNTNLFSPKNIKLDEISEDTSESKANPSVRFYRPNDMDVKRMSPRLRKNNMINNK